MKVLIVLAAAVALSAARPTVDGITTYPYGIGAYPYLGGSYPYLGGAAYPYLGGSSPYLGGSYPYLSGSYPYLGIPAAPATLAVAAPEPVKDTPEVAQAKAEHLEAVAKAAVVEEPTPVEEVAVPVPAPVLPVAPEPVQDTPEVAKARAEHLAAYEKAAAAAAAAPEVPFVDSGLLYPGLSFPGALGYSAVAPAPYAPFGYPALAPGRLLKL